MSRLRLSILIALLAVATAAPAVVPDFIAFLPDSERDAAMHQCSRPVPEPGERGWTPALEDVEALEAALPAALAARPMRDAPDWARLNADWRRQYVGLVRGGRRFLYGSFFPRSLVDDDETARWRTQAVIVCDGGASFFGVEYDAESGRITHLAFNGPG